MKYQEVLFVKSGRICRKTGTLHTHSQNFKIIVLLYQFAVFYFFMLLYFVKSSLKKLFAPMLLGESAIVYCTNEKNNTYKYIIFINQL